MMVVLLIALILGAATLYSSVGHGGASGYLAAMALLGVAASTMKPVALVLNIIVATIATLRFYRAGSFSWRTLWPFLIGSVPLAYVGVVVHLPGRIYKPLVGAILLFTAGRLAWSVWRGKSSLPQQIRAIPIIPAILWVGLSACFPVSPGQVAASS